MESWQTHKSRTLHNTALLRIFLYYRFVLGALLFTLFVSDLAPDIFGSYNPKLFQWTSLSYGLICLLTLLAFRVEDLRNSINRVSAFLVVDLVAILLLVHASGGIASGLGYLFLVTTAFASVLIRGQLGIAFAALISLGVIGETIYVARLVDITDSRSVFSAGVLGILVFATAFAFRYLTEKVRVSDIEAAAQAQYAEHLQRLAELIVRRMRTGIIVVDDSNRVELINESALQLLSKPADGSYTQRPLGDFSNLDTVLEEWQADPVPGVPRHHVLRPGQEVRINFALLDTGAGTRTLMFMEDHRLLTQQAQQLKLASLGRLTASIAHEVRNPLGAISHAAQLLSESPHLDSGDARLTEIIHQHSRRVNQIIENTLVLSRRRSPKPEVLTLDDWLPRFIEDYAAGEEAEINLTLQADDIVAKVDPIQLGQVLTNLLDNGLRYSKKATGQAKAEVVAGISRNQGTPYLEVIDFGEGVDDEKLQQIFDPFYTTDDQGSGLGLYISKELCEINQATLHYRRTKDDRSCFRINFSHHQRIF